MGVELGSLVPRKHRDDLHPYRAQVAGVRRHRRQCAPSVGEPGDLAEGKEHLSAGHRGQRGLHDLDAFAHREELPNLVLVEDGDLHGQPYPEASSSSRASYWSITSRVSRFRQEGHTYCVGPSSPRSRGKGMISSPHDGQRTVAMAVPAYPKNTSATSYSSSGTSLGCDTDSSSGTSTTSPPWRETIRPHAPFDARSMAATPNRVASTRSYAVGEPPRWT